MTGFEAWVKMGIELGAREVLEAEAEAADILEDCGQYDGTSSTEERAAAIAEVLMRRWPPWKREASKQKELPLAGRCSRCERKAGLLLGSAHGPLCRTCFDSYMRREWS